MCFHCSLYCTKQVMQRASKGLLAPTEHKWLGVSAYNLGLTLFRGELFGDAALVLELACEELLGWCEGGRSEEERVQRSEEVRVCTSVCMCVRVCVCVCVCTHVLNVFVFGIIGSLRNKQVLVLMQHSYLLQLLLQR